MYLFGLLNSLSLLWILVNCLGKMTSDRGIAFLVSTSHNLICNQLVCYTTFTMCQISSFSSQFSAASLITTNKCWMSLKNLNIGQETKWPSITSREIMTSLSLFYWLINYSTERGGGNVWHSSRIRVHNGDLDLFREIALHFVPVEVGHLRQDRPQNAASSVRTGAQRLHHLLHVDRFLSPAIVIRCNRQGRVRNAWQRKTNIRLIQFLLIDFFCYSRAFLVARANSAAGIYSSPNSAARTTSGTIVMLTRSAPHWR